MKLVIFDLDGTILDTVADLGGAVNRTLEARGLPVHSLPEYKMMVGRGMRNLVKAALPQTERRDDAFVDAFLKDFLSYYLSHIDCATLPYPGIPELMRTLSREGFALAVASNKLQEGTEKLIGKFFPEIAFTSVCGNSPRYPLKPDAALVEHIIGEAGARREDTVIVGDSEIDIRTAKNAGVPVVAVTWGFRPAEYLRDADFIAESAEQLGAVLTGKSIWNSKICKK